MRPRFSFNGVSKHMKRRDFVKRAGLGSAALVSLPGLALAQAQALTSAGSTHSLKKGEPPPDTFVVLLHGFYVPAVRCPDLGLSDVNLCDGTYSTTQIYPAPELVPDDLSEHGNRQGERHCKGEKTNGNFYVQFGGELAVYDLPGGALKMVFNRGTDHYTNVPDGVGGTFMLGTVDLTVTDATGVYRSFVGGHNTMVDILHQLADGNFFEHCYCFIRRP
jgi:hypothetical protein